MVVGAGNPVLVEGGPSWLVGLADTETTFWALALGYRLSGWGAVGS